MGPRKYRSACACVLLTSLLGTIGVPGLALAQADRRGRFEPGLILETGARAATFDQLRFTPDGQFLLGGGEDKVVRLWRVGEQGLAPEGSLRWPVWREQRGAIYAMAVSPDREGRYVAIAGHGVRTGTVVVFDRTTGKVKHAIKDPRDNDQAIWALAFSPKGDRLAFGTDDGGIWLWDLASGNENDVQRLGTSAPGRSLNRVRLVAFLDDRRLLSVAQDGAVLRWDGTERKELFRFKDMPNLFRVALSADRKWLAAGAETVAAVVVSNLDGTVTKRLDLPPEHYPQSLTLDARGERLAVGARVVPAAASFFKETDARIYLFDLTQKQPARKEGPRAKYRYRVDALSFDPAGKRLAVADGEDHQVALWSLDRLDEPVSVQRGPGSCLWGVALSEDGKQLGFQDQRAGNPDHPNHWGQGPYRVFDLVRRDWAPADGFRPVKARKTADGWKVETTADASAWYVVGPGGKRVKLPLDVRRDGLPRCYTFLGGNGKPVRLAVGHLWGVSIYDLGTGEPRRSRLLTGHQGEVMSVAPSADEKLLVTAGRDQLVAAWSLEPWQRQSELGASFELRLGKIYVAKVDPGSPAWQAGLAEGDEIVVFAFNAVDFLYDPENQVKPAQRARMKTVGNADQCLAQLAKPEPGKEFNFWYRRGEQTRLTITLTTVRQRPLWRFFPTRDGEWVLWRWLDYYYDTSTRGDSFIGWQVNGEVDETPVFYPSNQFKKLFHRPDKVSEVLSRARLSPERVAIPDVEPPELSLRTSATLVREQDITVSMAAMARGPRDFHQPDTVILWVNDYRYGEWKATGAEFQKEVVVPAAQLRRGTNRLVLQCFTRAGVFISKGPVVVTRETAPAPPTLFLVLVGVADYRAVDADLQKKDLGRLSDLPGTRVDLEQIQEIWKEQTKLFKEVKVLEPLKDRKATPAAILGQLREVAKQARPDDLLIFFLSGHGLSEDIARNTGYKERNFTFVCPTFDHQRPAETSLTGGQIYGALTKIPCRKLVLLNACHSGDVTSNPVRDLTPDGVGPLVLSACKPREHAFSDEAAGGLFVQAIDEALGKHFAKANRSGTGILDTQELVAYVAERVPEILKDAKGKLKAAARTPKEQQQIEEVLRASQTPDFFPDFGHMERYPVGRK